MLVERREEDKDVRTGQRRTGQRRADVVLYNYDTNETISAVVILAPGPQRVADLAVIRGQPRGLSAEEVQEAQQLALAHPAVQAALQAAGLAGRESELIITHMHVRAAAPDRCSTHRCVALSFNTRDAVLGIEPVVDLTTGDVAVQ